MINSSIRYFHESNYISYSNIIRIHHLNLRVLSNSIIVQKYNIETIYM